MLWALSNPGPAGGTPDSAAYELNKMLTNQPGKMLQAQVDGPAFHALLEKIPLPAAHTSAPPTASAHP
jgi:hypothetical protein